MPDTRAYLEQRRAAYVADHSFVLLIAYAVLAQAIQFFEHPNAQLQLQAAKCRCDVDPPTLLAVRLDYAWSVLFVCGSLALIAGLLGLSFSVECAGHTLLTGGLLASGWYALGHNDLASLDGLLNISVLVVSTGCVLLRLSILLMALKLINTARWWSG